MKVKDIINVYTDNVFNITLKNGLYTFNYRVYKENNGLNVKISIFDENDETLDIDDINILSEANVKYMNVANDELNIECYF